MSKLGVAAVLAEEVKPHEVMPIRRQEWMLEEDRFVSFRGLVDASTLLSDVTPVFDLRLLSVVAGELSPYTEFTLLHPLRTFWFRGLVVAVDGSAVTVAELQVISPLPDVRQIDRALLPPGFKIIQDQTSGLYFPIRTKDGDRPSWKTSKK
jgi:hypothetical protein